MSGPGLTYEQQRKVINGLFDVLEQQRYNTGRILQELGKTNRLLKKLVDVKPKLE